jgi:hypothetical protein
MGNGIVKWIDGYTEEEYAEMRRKSIEKSIALYEYEQLLPILKREILYEKYYDFIKGKILISECLSYYELLSKIFIDTIQKVEYDQRTECFDSLGIIQDILKKIENIPPNGGYPPSETPDRVNPAIQEMIEKKQVDQDPLKTIDQWIGKEKLDLVFAWYPEFKSDFKLLEKNGYLEKDGGFLKWKKSKQSLAEYFGDQRSGDNKWEIVENLFNTTGLKNAYSPNGNAFKTRSKDYEKWLKIKNTPLSK